ncbi:hypothetical protein L0222_29170 [bacterium]|nr:hypothetical protein [bacterium]
MECNSVPAPEIWDQLDPEGLKACRLHVQYCRACRTRVLNSAPDQLLFDIQNEPLPEDFWLGFWNSLHQKRRVLERPISYHPLRRVAVFLLGFLILLYGRPIRDEGKAVISSAQISRAANAVLPISEVPSYPVIENLENPDARYYIFQSGEQEKIVMVFDPDMEL